jgi:hypothetical protein
MTRNPEGIMRRAAAKRAAAERRADTELSRIAGVLIDQGEDANIARTSIETGIPRSTLYRRMDEVRRLRESSARAARIAHEVAHLPSLDSPDAPAPAPADTDR